MPEEKRPQDRLGIDRSTGTQSLIVRQRSIRWQPHCQDSLWMTIDTAAQKFVLEHSICCDAWEAPHAKPAEVSKRIQPFNGLWDSVFNHGVVVIGAVHGNQCYLLAGTLEFTFEGL